MQLYLEDVGLSRSAEDTLSRGQVLGLLKRIRLISVGMPVIVQNPKEHEWQVWYVGVDNVDEQSIDCYPTRDFNVDTDTPTRFTVVVDVTGRWVYPKTAIFDVLSPNPGMFSLNRECRLPGPSIDPPHFIIDSFHLIATELPDIDIPNVPRNKVRKPFYRQKSRW